MRIVCLLGCDALRHFGITAYFTLNILDIRNLLTWKVPWSGYWGSNNYSRANLPLLALPPEVDTR